MAWEFNPKTQTTLDDTGVISRLQMEDCVERLKDAGIKNQLLIVDVMKALSSLSHGEIRYTVSLVFGEEQSVSTSARLPATRQTELS